MEIPVYLFTGFLDAGKTRFIQETLEDKRFNKGERTLVLLCEEGETELEPSKFPGKNVAVETVEEPEELTADHLTELQKKHRAQRVIVEYNGMWMLQQLFDALPANWVIYQEMLFMDANTVLSYNANMRGLVVDKLNTPELVVFNRMPREMDKMPLHKLVRGVSRRPDIAYDHGGDDVEYDDIEDPLPFDVNAPVIEIADGDYALWYRDLSEGFQGYDGKTVSFKGQVVQDKTVPAGCFIVGRPLMTCCADDIRFAGLACEWADAKELNNREWVQVQASVSVRKHPCYGRVGPVLTAVSVTRVAAPENEVATFY